MRSFRIIPLLTLCGVLGAAHSSTCGKHDELPPRSGGNCQWVVVKDYRNCNTYVEECGEVVNSCADDKERLWKCSSLCEPTCDDQSPQCAHKCGPPKCQCALGFARADDGTCIKLQDCARRQENGCGRNEEIRECSSMCEPTCSSKDPQLCFPICDPQKCQCRNGYVRHQDECIRREQCPQNDPHICGRNEVLKSCTSLCNLTCSSLSNEPCPEGCGPPGCECIEGYVRNWKGKCIRIERCSLFELPKCERNERFVACTSLCNRTCSTPSNEPCPTGCGFPGCECVEGYVRNWRGKCIPVEQCSFADLPKRCAINEEFVMCRSLCNRTCHFPSGPCPLACGSPGCQCLDGYVRNLRGKCIPVEQCPSLDAPPCGENEEFETCRTQCEPTCSWEFKICPRKCGPPKCICKMRFVRGPNGQCISPLDCPKSPVFAPSSSCAVNEVFTKCSSKCEGTCANPFPQCNRMCAPPSCQCKRGYLRNDEGICVRTSQCPQRGTAP